MNRRRLAALVLAVIGTAAATAPAQGILGGTPAETQDPALVGPLLTPDQQPKLTSEQIASLTAIVENAEPIRTLFGAAPFNIRSTGPWTRENSLEPFGAVVELRFENAVDVSGSWPAIDYAKGRDAPDAPFTSRVAKMSATKMTDALVLVDFETKAVVSVQPGEGTDVKLAPGEPTSAPNDSGPD